MEQFFILNVIAIWLVVAVNLLLTLALIRRVNNDKGRTPNTLSPGQEAPNFTAEFVDGQTANLSTFKNKEVVLYFFSPHCSPCREQIPVIEKFYPKAKANNIDIVGVSTVSAEETQSFVKDNNIKYPVLIATRRINPFYKDYKVAGTPWYCHIDKQSKVVDSGIADWEELESNLWPAINESETRLS